MDGIRQGRRGTAASRRAELTVASRRRPTPLPGCPPEARWSGGSPALREPIAEDAPDTPGGGPVTITVRGQIGEAEAGAVLRLVEAVTAQDGVGPLSEQVLLHVRHGGNAAARNLLLFQGGELAGFAHMNRDDPAEGGNGELAVHPARRRQGLGLELAHALVAESGGRPVQVWAHGDLPAAARLATAAGFTRMRALWRMHRSLRPPLGTPIFPERITVRTFIPGQDEAEWLGLNGRAFASHPEQGRWTRGDLDLREREPWFDPAGFFLAERDGRLVGFHWTKIHDSSPLVEGSPSRAGGTPPGAGGTPPGLDDGDADRTGEPTRGPVGEVYVVGVDPAEQGTGLGRALTLVGLHHLRDRGIPEVMLYVDESNGAAIRLYESLGFSRTGTDVMYRYAAGSSRLP